MRKRLLSIALACVLALVLFPSLALPVSASGDMTKIGSFNTISASDHFSAAITTNGDLYMWGSDWDNKLGLGSIAATGGLPKRMPSLSNMASISLGDYHCAVISTDEKASVWGNNLFGQLGLGGNNRPTVVTISLGGFHSAAITAAGDLYTWGCNASGQLGLGDINNRDAPIKVSGLSDVVAVCLGTSSWGSFSGGSVINSFSGIYGHSAAIPLMVIFILGEKIYMVSLALDLRAISRML